MRLQVAQYTRGRVLGFERLVSAKTGQSQMSKGNAGVAGQESESNHRTGMTVGRGFR